MRRSTTVLSVICASGVAFAGWGSCTATEKRTTTPATYKVSVNFDNGHEVWTAESANWTDHRAEYNEVNVYFEGQGQFPVVMGRVMPDEATVFSEMWHENEYLFLEYYSLNWPKIGDALRDFQRGILYGDWQAESGTVTITSISDTHISGTAELVMYNLVEYAINRNDNPATKPLSVVFSDVPLNTETASGRVLSRALSSPDRSFSFSGARIVPEERR